MPRLFSGIEIPANVKTELALLQSGLENARWISPENFHITLRFAGDIDDIKAAEFSHFLSQIDFASFEITLRTMGSFGGRKPRAVWVGIDATPVLDELHRAHEMAARHAGLEPESRKFIPHVTLARLRNVSASDTARYLENKGHVALTPFSVTRTVLFSSRPGGGGGPYHVEEAYAASDNYSEFDAGNS